MGWRPLENAFHQARQLQQRVRLLGVLEDCDLVTNHHEHLHGGGSANCNLCFQEEVLFLGGRQMALAGNVEPA